MSNNNVILINYTDVAYCRVAKKTMWLLSFSSNEKIGKDKCSAVGCPGTDLTDLNTYFSEHVLEDSNASNYFNVYVAGFTLAPKVPAMIMPSNKTNSSGTSPVASQTETTVWYSNEVNRTGENVY